MFLASLRFRRASNDIGLGLAVAFLVAGGLASGGCAAIARPSAAQVAATRTPFPDVVPTGRAFAAAERIAADHPGDFVLTGEGRSMEPTYHAGTVLVVHPTEMHMLRAGMTVVYRSPRGTLVAHVLVEKWRESWIAQGLNNADPDETRVREENLVGIVRHAYSEGTVVAGEL